MGPTSFWNNSRRHRSRHAFTLVELLITIGIIALLVALVFPAINRARESAHEVVCQDHLRQLWHGFTQFAADNDGRLPGSYADNVINSNPPHFNWAGDPNKTVPVPAPRNGTIFKYVKDANVYHCPSIEPGTPSADLGQTVNPYFDYVSFPAWSGVHLNRVPSMTQVSHTTTSQIDTIPTPIICEYLGIPGVSNGHRMAHQHRGGYTIQAPDGSIKWQGGGCFYVSPDGAVNWYTEPDDVSSHNYYVTTMRGTNYTLDAQVGWGVFEIW
jgi:prepilin-type N-terminal cleavage/methylation domain-containing protein